MNRAGELLRPGGEHQNARRSFSPVAPSSEMSPSSILDSVDPSVRECLRVRGVASTGALELPGPLDSSKVGKPLVLTGEQFLAARKVGIDSVKELAEKIPATDGLWVDLDKVLGGITVVYVSAVIRNNQQNFHPDLKLVTAGKFKEAALTVHGAMNRLSKKDENKRNLFTLYSQKK